MRSRVVVVGEGRGVDFGGEARSFRRRRREARSERSFGGCVVFEGGSRRLVLILV